MLSAHCLARLLGRCATGGANHPQQPFGGPGGYRQLRGSGLKWTTGGSRGWLPRLRGPLARQPAGGVLVDDCFKLR